MSMLDISSDSDKVEVTVYTKPKRVGISVSHEMVTYWSDELQKYAKEIKDIADETKAHVDKVVQESVQSDWNEVDDELISFIKNKPSIPAATGDLTNNSGFITINDVPVYTAGDGISITGNVISNTRNSASWGNITGTVLNQTDLVEYIDEKIPCGNSLFDTKLSDHVLTGDEAKGWALQGTYVNKNSALEIAGYPNFYQKCLAEKNAGVETQTALGESTITTYNNANGHVYYNIADKEVVDAFYGANGVCWMYGIDTENERIFLPRNDWFEQCAAANAGEFVEPGLPNITGKYYNSSNYSLTGGSIPVSGEGACTVINRTTNAGSFSVSAKEGPGVYNFNASLSNPIYGNSESVQPASVKKLLYICVGNTEVESAITGVTQITTSENDTIPLFTGMYFDFVPNNPSWLKAGEQKNSAGIYASCYNTLVSCLTPANNIYDLKVIASADKVTGTDYSEYWEVNQEGMWFRTPLRSSFLGKRILVEKKEPTESDPTWYNLYSDGWCEQGGYNYSASIVLGFWNVSLLKSYKDTNYEIQITLGGKNTSERATVTQQFCWSDTKTLSDFNWAAVGGDAKAYKLSGYWRAYGYVETNIAMQVLDNLYFKVANAVQSLALLDAGEVLESLADKQDKCVHITETYQNGNSWYRVYSDGWCEQGGKYVTTATSSLTSTINFLKKMGDSCYNYQVTPYSVQSATDAGELNVYNITTEAMTVTVNELSATSAVKGFCWSVRGYKE